MRAQLNGGISVATYPIFDAYRKFLQVEGRASVLQYWVFVLFLIAVIVLAQILAFILYKFKLLGLTLGVLRIAPIFLVISVIPWLSLSVRRLHDINKSGFWLWIGLVPIVGFIVLVVMWLAPGTKGSNDFGPVPGTPAPDPASQISVPGDRP